MLENTKKFYELGQKIIEIIKNINTLVTKCKEVDDKQWKQINAIKERLNYIEDHVTIAYETQNHQPTPEQRYRDRRNY